MNNLTDAEIRTLWKYKDLLPKAMILCLSQLEGCEYREMRDHCEFLGLIGEGEYLSYRRNKSTEADGEIVMRKFCKAEVKEIFRMVEKGIPHKEIARILGRPLKQIRYCIYKNRSKLYDNTSR